MKYIVWVLAILIFVFAITSSSCRKPEPCGEQSKDTTFLGAYEKSVIPYKLNDTINFKHSTGEIWSYNHANIYNGFGFMVDNVYYHCPGLLFYQYINYNLSKLYTTKNTWDIKLTIGFLYGGNTAYLIVNYKLIDFNRPVADIPPPPSKYYEYDSLLVGDIYYKHVAKLVYSGFSHKENSLYYNREYGVLKIVTDDETLERIP